MLRLPLLVLSIALLLTSLVSCKKEKPIPESCIGLEFSYSGEEGPDNWGDICGGWAACGTNSFQSPVNIMGSVFNPVLPAYNPEYNEVIAEITNTGHSLQFNVNNAGGLRYKEMDYELVQFHLHAQSEHQLSGKNYPMEVHLVHRNKMNDNLLVVGVFIEEGETNISPILTKYVGNLPFLKGGTYTPTEKVDLMDLVPNDRRYFVYSGSSTTPPCSEIKTWIVLKKPIVLNKGVLFDFQYVLKNNNRPVQPLNGRTIFEN